MTPLQAARVVPGDRLFVPAVPYARPTALTVGWHEVIEVQHYEHPNDVVGLRILPNDMTERNDVLYFNEKEKVCVIQKRRG